MKGAGRPSLFKSVPMVVFTDDFRKFYFAQEKALAWRAPDNWQLAKKAMPGAVLAEFASCFFVEGIETIMVLIKMDMKNTA